MDEKVISEKRKRRKRRTSLKRIYLVMLAFLIVFSSGIFWVNAEIITEGEIPRLSKVGPIHEDNGYPVWYKDDQGTRLQLCLDVNDPLCALDPAEIPRPLEPISLAEDNFPEEAFYQLASAEIDMPSGGRAVATFALEAAWANEIVQDGDQIVFGRVRLRVDDLITGQEYTITHPYGTDKFTATEEDEDNPTVGEIRFVEDIGINGGFEGAMKSRIGRFLEWDTGAPEGYIGDPNVEHKIKGGYKDQNYFRIQGPGLGTGTCGENCIETDLFSLMGKKATTSGVDIARATYSRTTTESGTIDVFASTEEGEQQTIEATSGDSEPVRLKGTNGQYFTRLSYTGENPPKITVTNVTDNPDSKKEIIPVDKITATADYDVTTDTLKVTAVSSDQAVPPKMTLKGYMLTVPAEGLTITNPAYVPPNVTISSDHGGSVIIPVNVSGDAITPNAPVANAGAEQSVNAGDTVTLQGTNTGGEATTILWEQVSPVNPVVEIIGENTLAPTFTAPGEGGEFVFRLTLTGPDGTSTSTVKVIVASSVPVKDPVANAGTDQVDVMQNSRVILDGSASTDTATYKWEQTAGTQVTLDLTDPAKPTFITPKKMETLTFKLTAVGTNGVETTDVVNISTKADTLAVTTAEYDARRRTWRIDGTSDVIGPNVKVTVYIGTESSINKLVEIDVDTTGEFRYRGAGRPIVQGGTITLVSSSGGRIENRPVTVK